MSELTLDDVRAFNADLLTVNAAGVPLNVGLNSAASQTALQTELQAMEATLSTLGGGDTPVSELLKHNPRFPLQYVATLQHWSDAQRAPIAFDPSSAAMASERWRWGTLAVNFVHPASWLLLAYVAMVIVCGGLVPMLEAQNRQMRIAPGPVLSFLLTLRAWMPVWLVALPIMAAVVVVVLYRRRHARSSRQSPGLSQAEALRRAQLAEQASQMLAQGASRQQVITVLRERTQAGPPAPALDLSAQATTTSKTLPPLLEWASSFGSLEEVQTASSTDSSLAETDAFQRAAIIYRGIAHQLEQSRVANRPLRIAVVLAGGLLVLGVALSIFGPVIEMLLNLAEPTAT